jgi:hypothetical protein
MVLYEDPQCPHCKRLEETSGDLLRREIAAGSVNVEYRMRCFLGTASVRASNALALAAEAGHFDQLRAVLFAAQPPEGSNGFDSDDLIELGRQAGISDPSYASGIREGRYEPWVQRTDEGFQLDDPDGTPAASLDGQPIDQQILFDPDVLGDLIRR